MKNTESAAAPAESAAEETVSETVTVDTKDAQPTIPTTKKVISINPWLGAACVAGVLGATYFTGRYFGYQAALRAVAAAASQA